jgi:hypothetical protein
MSSRVVCSVLVVCTLAGFSATSAQSATGADSALAWASWWPEPTGCVDAQEPPNNTSRIVYLDANLPANSVSAFTAQGDLLAKDVDIELRKMLGGSESEIPFADSSVTWRAVRSELVVSARADGSMKWRGVSQFGDSAATRLLSIALDSARKHGGALMLFPDGFAPDSLMFRLSFRPDPRQRLGAPDSLEAKRAKFGAFRIAYPGERPAFPVSKSATPVYPHFSELRQVTGRVIVQFIVDTTGRADMSTFSDMWPSDKPRLTGSLGGYYDDFVSSLRDYVAKEKFTPASVGSCRVRQWVRWPVNFQGNGQTGTGSKSQ